MKRINNIAVYEMSEKDFMKLIKREGKLYYLSIDNGFITIKILESNDEGGN